MSRAQLTSTVEQNSAGAAAPYVAGKNVLINGDFAINQRNFTSTTTNATYGFDRWNIQESSNATYSLQTFTAGAAPVAGYEGKNFARIVTSGQSSASDYAALNQRVEGVRTFAGQTVTYSFWARASSGTPNVGVTLVQNLGSGGTGGNSVISPAIQAITTSWVRYSFVINLPSLSGKTVGTGDMLETLIFTSNGTSLSSAGYAATGVQNTTIDIWGVQLEKGSVATPFTTASGTLQGELALCQRYFWQISSANIDRVAAQAISSTRAFGPLPLPVTMRTAPSYSFAAASNFGLINSSGGVLTCTTVSIAAQATNMVTLDFTSSGGGLTAGNATACWFQSTSSTIALSAEL